MKQLLLAALMITGVVSSQNLFKPGYLVGNDGVRTECLIKDQGWKNNPRAFTGHGLSANPDTETNFSKMGLVLRYNILK